MTNPDPVAMNEDGTPLILNIGPESEARRARSAQLRQLRFEVDELAPDDGALARLPLRQPALIVVACSELPDGGRALCLRLRNHDRTAGAPILLIGPGTDGAEDGAALADARLPETIDPWALREVARALVRRNAHRSENAAVTMRQPWELPPLELEALFEAMHEGLALFDGQGRPITLNRAALALHGFRDAGEMVARLDHFHELFDCFDADGEAVPIEQRPVARALAGEDVAEVEVHGVRKDNGSRFTALYRATPVFDDVGEVVWVVATMRDVTLRKRAEHILKESAGQFRTLADSIPQLAWMADATGWLFWYNRRWYDYTGTTLETMEGWGWRSVHHPAHVDRVEEGFRRCIEAESESGCAVTTASSST